MKEPTRAIFPEAVAEEGGVRVAFSGLRVLVVDDDMTILRFLVDLFRFWGCSEVEMAINGEEAVSKYQQFRPDFVLMDMDMPLMNGFDASQAIVELDAQSCIILVSGLPDSRLARKALEKGLVRLTIPKPFNFDQLKMAIQDALRQTKSSEVDPYEKGAVA